MVAGNIAGRLGAALGLVLIAVSPSDAQESARESADEWGVAGEAVRWTLLASGGGEDVLDSKSVLVRWRPESVEDFHLLGGVGYVAYRFGYDRDDPVGRTIGPTVGVGYDLDFPGEVTIVPRLRWTAGALGDPSLESEVRPGRAATSLVQIGVGLTWKF